MKIGLIGSGGELLPIMKVLSLYDHEYHLYIDRAYRPRGEKSEHLIHERVQKGLSYMNQIGVDAVIVSPAVEMMLADGSLSLSGSLFVLPLFKQYLFEYALTYSLVGKLGLLCDQSDMTENTQQRFSSFISSYERTSHQKNTKIFHADFPVWKKNVRMRKYFLTTYGARDPMVRKTLKFDLRYLSDAGVDTLIPMSWGHLFFQKLIKQRVNWKKVRFHGIDIRKECFDTLCSEKKLEEDTYSVTLHCTDHPTALLQEKKWMWVLQRGKRVAVKVELI